MDQSDDAFAFLRGMLFHTNAFIRIVSKNTDDTQAASRSKRGKATLSGRTTARTREGILHTPHILVRR